MKTKYTKLEKNLSELNVTIDGEAWETAQNKALKKLAATVKVDGFREGKVPENIAKARIGAKAILEEAVDFAMNEVYGDLLKDNDIKPIAQPQLNIEAITETELRVTLKFECEPEVTLGEYKGLHIDKAEVSVSETDIDARVETIREECAELLVKEDGVVAKGDTAVIDFEGFKDGIAFDGGKAEGHSLVIGSGSFIPGFEEQVEGMGIGEVKDINVTFPEQYQAEELAGQPVVFKVKVNEIKSKRLPELDDDFALDANIDGVNTYAELRAHVEKTLLEEKTKQADTEYENQLFKTILDNASVELPEVMVQEEMMNMLQNAKQNMERQGFGFDMYLQMVGKTQAEVIEEFRPQAEESTKFTLVMSEIVKAENIVPSQEDIDGQLSQMAEMYGMEVDAVRNALIQNGYINRLVMDIAINKAMEVIRESTK